MLGMYQGLDHAPFHVQLIEIFEEIQLRNLDRYKVEDLHEILSALRDVPLSKKIPHLSVEKSDL